jgi:heat shock protein HslJ
MFAACTVSKVKSVSQSGITDIEWTLVATVSGNDLLTTENVKKQTTLKIETGGKVYGNGGCNDYSGVSTVSGQNIKFDKLVVTQKACFDVKIETAFFDALRDADSFAVESGNLKLKKGDKVVATFSTLK